MRAAVGELHSAQCLRGDGRRAVYFPGSSADHSARYTSAVKASQAFASRVFPTVQPDDGFLTAMTTGLAAYVHPESERHQLFG